MPAPAFLPAPALRASRVLAPLSRLSPPPSCRRRLHAPPVATLSLPRERIPRPRDPVRRFSHSEQTKRKISIAVARRAATRRARLQRFVLSIREGGPASSESESESASSGEGEPAEEEEEEVGVGMTPEKPRRRLSKESRAKISAALKGRRKSKAHREALRARFEGDGNPMFGRKLSKESRAKISAAMARRGARKRQREEDVRKDVSEEVMADLREKAAVSRLLADAGKGLHTPGKRRGKRERSLKELAEMDEIDHLLNSVAALDKPPQNVVRTLENNRRMREDDEGEANLDDNVTCPRCKATGFVACPKCIGAFGVVSARCHACFGAGAVFCETCQGVGQLAQGGVC